MLLANSQAIITWTNDFACNGHTCTVHVLILQDRPRVNERNGCTNWTQTLQQSSALTIRPPCNTLYKHQHVLYKQQDHVLLQCMNINL